MLEDRKNSLELLLLVIFAIGVVFISGCMSNSGGGIPPNTHVSTPSLVTPWGTLGGEVSGQDLPCVGHYDNMVRGVYTKSSEPDGSYETQIVYYKQGDTFNDAKSYFVSKLQDCDYTKNSENEGSFSAPGFQMLKEYDADYSRDNDDLSLAITILKLNDKEYTFVNIDYNHYSQNPSENTPSENTSSENPVDDYGSQTEVPPNGDLAQQFNSIIKPTLVSIYGGAKLIKSSTMSYGGMQGVDLTYFVKKPVKATDDSALGGIMRNAGYQVISDEVSDSDISITSMKDDKPALSLNAMIGGQEIEFVGYKIQ
ncbi:MAG: hypothetical protein GWP09_01135 [Nitrospiraceae bacterium]|nr:hypothetical protein [Nitrospiraceae bacterium]